MLTFLHFLRNRTVVQKYRNALHFEDHTIRLEAYNQAFLTGGTRSLIDLAFSLHGSEAECEVRFLFNTLDDRNSILALQAIKYRFQIPVEIDDLK